MTNILRTYPMLIKHYIFRNSICTKIICDKLCWTVRGTPLFSFLLFVGQEIVLRSQFWCICINLLVLSDVF